jgi:type III secretion system low calcium response chaperone LcrH/SycD
MATMEISGIDENELRELLVRGTQLVKGQANEDVVDVALGVIKGEIQYKDIQGITEQEMEAAYAKAYASFQAGSYARAESLFEFLVTFDNGTRKYWTALGACRFNMGKYENALACYSSAIVLDVRDPGLMIKIAQCHIALRRRDEAAAALEVALELTEDEPARYRAETERAAAMLALLQPKH